MKWATTRSHDGLRAATSYPRLSLTIMRTAASDWVSGSERSRNYRWKAKLIKSSVLKGIRRRLSIDILDLHSSTPVDTRSTPRWTFGRESTNFRSMQMSRSILGRISTIDFRLSVSIWSRPFFVTYTQEQRTQEKKYKQIYNTSCQSFYNQPSQSTDRSRFGWMTFLYSLTIH